MESPTIRRRARQLVVSAALFSAAAAPAALADDNEVLMGYLKSMADNVSSQEAISFDYDASFDIVTTEKEIITIASSGTVVLERPDHLQVTRTGGFGDMEILFDGKEATMFSETENAYIEKEMPGSVDDLMTELDEKLGFPVPAVDLLSPNSYQQLKEGITEVKGLGAGVIDGTTCDHLAFRTKSADWQIWMTQGENPRPCRYMVISTDISGAPRYTIDFTDWKTGDDVADTDFTFENTTKAKEVSVNQLRKLTAVFPPNFTPAKLSEAPSGAQK